MTIPVHPFPARMAPELIHQFFKSIPQGFRVLDPMCGSGTVVRIAAEAGLQCSGVDIDPLAVLMARVWTVRLDPKLIIADAEELVLNAKKLRGRVKITTDPETEKFINYWFAQQQRSELTCLATALQQQRKKTKDALAVALSRIIITKSMKASLALDTSHSRPHKVAQDNDYNVYSGFLRSAQQIANKLKPNLLKGKTCIYQGDARTLTNLADDSFECALTSPPYLNAIDYLRGHRLALVWLGYEIEKLRITRSDSVGAERVLPATQAPIDVSSFVKETTNATFSSRHKGWVSRYAKDMNAILHQIRRVVKSKGKTVLVLGNSFLRGATIDNAKLIENLALRLGFILEDKKVREIPARRRYLPPPGDGQQSFDNRMRSETILTFSVP